MQDSKFKGHMAAIVTNLIFGLNMSVTKALFAASWMNSLGFAMTRMVFGLVMFWTISFFMPREKVAPRDIPVLAGTGALGLAITQFVFFNGLELMSPVLTSLITALGPIIVLLLSAIFLADPISMKKTIGVIIGIVGAFLVVIQNFRSGISLTNVWGVGIILIGVVCHSFYIIIMRKISGKYSPVTIMKWLFFGGFILLSPFGLPELSKQRLFSQEATFLPVIQLLFSLVFSGLFAVILMPMALRRLKATIVSMYTNLQPLAASTAAIVVGQDVFSWDKPLALLLIVSGVFIVNQSQTPGKIERRTY